MSTYHSIAKGCDPNGPGVMERLGDFKASKNRGQWDIKPRFGKRAVAPEKNKLTERRTEHGKNS